MNPKKAKEMFFHSELSEEVVITDVVVGVAIKKKKLKHLKICIKEVNILHIYFFFQRTKLNQRYN